MSLEDWIDRKPFRPIVIKLDGLAGGKGVWVCHTRKEALEVLNGIFKTGHLVPEGYKEIRPHVEDD